MMGPITIKAAPPALPHALIGIGRQDDEGLIVTEQECGVGFAPHRTEDV